LLPKRRQIVKNGVDQVDLGGVGENPETKKRKKLFRAVFDNLSPFSLFFAPFSLFENQSPRPFFFFFFVSGSGTSTRSTWSTPFSTICRRFRAFFAIFASIFVRFLHFFSQFLKISFYNFSAIFSTIYARFGRKRGRLL
jgi:hypothetical protein